MYGSSLFMYCTAYVYRRLSKKCNEFHLVVVSFSAPATSYILPSVITPLEGGNCPSDESRMTTRHGFQVEAESLLSRLLPQSNCLCGAGEWRRIAHLDMSDPNQQCPPNWKLITTPVRACGGADRSCVSAVFTSNGISYSHVCGRVDAYQKGSPNAFNPSISNQNVTLEGLYLDGVSLTHGAIGSRQHIWTFAAALSVHVNESFGRNHACPCTSTNYTWPYQIPGFVEDNYFCEAGNIQPGHSLDAVYQENLLWDGTGCGPTSTCCQFNTPPWFCTTLPQATMDDIEVRICNNMATLSNEDVLVSYININVM